VATLFALSSCVVHATFIESFAPSSPNTPSTAPPNQLRYLWQQSGAVNQGGRGATDTTGFTMVLHDGKTAAETSLLTWDKTTPAELVFYAAKEDVWGSGESCGGNVQMLFSEDGIHWSKQWEKDLKEWDPQGFEPVSITLPLAEGASKFAVKWTYTQPKLSWTCYRLDLDDITFPAEPPGPAVKPVSSPQPPKSKPAMPPGVAPPPFPATFAGTCTWAATYCGSAAAATTHNVTNSTGRGVNATTTDASTETITANAATTNTTYESTVEEATATSAGNDTATPAPADPTADDPAANAMIDTTTAPASRHGGNAAAQSLPGRKLKQLVLEANGL
jgi:hypothetical protein